VFDVGPEAYTKNLDAADKCFLVFLSPKSAFFDQKVPMIDRPVIDYHFRS